MAGSGGPVSTRSRNSSSHVMELRSGFAVMAQSGGLQVFFLKGKHPAKPRGATAAGLGHHLQKDYPQKQSWAQCAAPLALHMSKLP